MPEEPNTQVKTPFEQLLEKINAQDARLQALETENTNLKAQFKDFSDFNASLLNQGSGQPSSKADDEAKKKRRQYLDDICRKGAMK